MKKLYRYILLIVLCALTACRTEEPFEMIQEQGLPDGTPVLFTLSFDSPEMPLVEVSTKSSLDKIDESRIYNMYVLIFDSEGNKIYGRLFDSKDLVADKASLEASTQECWYVDYEEDGDSVIASGAVKVATVSKSGCTVYVSTNLGLSNATVDGKTTFDQYNSLQSLSELRERKMRLAEADIMSKGYLPMSGSASTTVSGASINTGTMTHDNTDNTVQVLVHMKRFYAKVTFRIRENSTYVSNFEPLLWSVSNVPYSTYVLERPVSYGTNGVLTSDSADAPGEYFDTPEIFFEGTEIETIDSETVKWYVISFYMLENRLVPRSVITGNTHVETDKNGTAQTRSNYYLRELQDKSDIEGGYVKNGAWTYANEHSTYVKFSANMVLTKAGLAGLTGIPVEDVTQVGLTTQAEFTVHLGDFLTCDTGSTHNFNNYSTERNHSYTYDIVVNNAKSIYTEVKDHNLEPQQGMEGGIIVADQSIINCDAHYENHLMEFNYLDPDEIGQRFTWFVKTPFSEGSPVRLYEDGALQFDSEGNMIFDATGLDYKWVSFLPNEISSGEYVQTRQPYPGDGSSRLMDVSQLINWLYKESKKWKSAETRASSVFYNGTDNSQRKVRVTAFINEFYYEKHPLTGELNPLLWKTFVNAPAREMHILSNAEYSKDRQSTVITSSHSVVQRSIQSFYNVDSPSLRALYGAEYMDEYEDENWPFDNGTPSLLADKERGRLNTSYAWGLTNNAGATWTSRNWSDYLDFRVGENVPQLNSTHMTQIYACMVRNRDNNGDGIIDKDEVRWYLAAVGQLNGMWLGDDSLAEAARLYHKHDGQLHHILTSTSDGRGSCRVIWAEEGNSNSFFIQSQPVMSDKYSTDMWKHYSIRCLRNVGTYENEDGKMTDISYGPVGQVVDDYVKIDVTGTGDDRVIRFDFENLNKKSKRFFSPGELIAADETSVQNRVYQVFEVASISSLPVADKSFGRYPEQINGDITDTGINTYCPAGYRLPNQREAAMLAYYQTDFFPGYLESGKKMPTRTYFSYGGYGRRKTGTDGIGYDSSENKYKGYFMLENDRTNLNTISGMFTNNSVRCVKDVDATASLSVKLLGSDGSTFSEEFSTTPSKNVSLHRAVYSPYSLIETVEVYLCYFEKSTGHYVQTKIFEEINPGKNNEDAIWSYTMPDLNFWNGVDRSKAIKFKMTATNKSGTAKSSEVSLNVQMINVEPVDPVDW